ncbi:Protein DETOXIFICATION 42 [Zea mays]|uniref:Protein DETOXIFICATION 42 n=1 Tax=Zea mays TaxID=4577 RepID=A0A1D6F930_MAIZE|nr:Protein DETOXIFICATION 42 [Zea mays]
MKKQGSHSRNLRRVRLGLGLIKALFEQFLDTEEQLIVRLNETGFLLLARVIAATCCVTLSASMAAQLGSTPMAAFQICLQTWLAYSLLADGLAFAGQAILASAFARKDHPKATATASRILQLALVLGLLLSILLGVGLRIGSRLFTSDQGVLHHIYIGIPVRKASTAAKQIGLEVKFSRIVGQQFYGQHAHSHHAQHSRQPPPELKPRASCTPVSW